MKCQTVHMGNKKNISKCMLKILSRVLNVKVKCPFQTHKVVTNLMFISPDRK